MQAGQLELTGFVGEAEGDHFIRDAADIPHRGDAAVVGVVLRSQVLQLQDLGFSLEKKEEGTSGRDGGRGKMEFAVWIWDFHPPPAFPSGFIGIDPDVTSTRQN